MGHWWGAFSRAKDPYCVACREKDGSHGCAILVKGFVDIRADFRYRSNAEPRAFLVDHTEGALVVRTSYGSLNQKGVGFTRRSVYGAYIAQKLPPSLRYRASTVMQHYQYRSQCRWCHSGTVDQLSYHSERIGYHPARIRVYIWYGHYSYGCFFIQGIAVLLLAYYRHDSHHFCQTSL